MGFDTEATAPPPNFFFLEMLIYSVCLIIFIGLLATVGVNMVLSHVVLSTITDASYLYTFAKANGILFWSATAMLFLFVASCSTFFRCIPVFSLRKKPVTKMAFFTTFLGTFFWQWSIVLLLIVLTWVGGRFAAKNVLPFTKQTPSYENRAEYYERKDPLRFTPQEILKES